MGFFIFVFVDNLYIMRTIFYASRPFVPVFVSIRMNPKMKKKRYLNDLLLDYLTNRQTPILGEISPRAILKCNIIGWFLNVKECP